MQNAKRVIFALVLVAAAAAFGMLPALVAHSINPLPIHADEYHHLAIANQFYATGVLPALHPYFNFTQPTHLTINEPLFPVIESNLAVLFGTQPLASAVLLPYALAALFALVAFAIGRRIAGLPGGVLAVASAIMLKSTTLLLGTAYAVPFALGASVLLVYWLALDSRNNPLAAILLLVAVFLNPPLAACLVLGTALSWVADALLNKKQAAPGQIALALGAGLVLAAAMWHRLALSGPSSLFFPLGAEDFVGNVVLVPLVTHVGIIACALAVAGAWHAARRKNFATLSLALPLLAIALLGEFAGIAPFLPYRRSVGYLAIALIPLAVIGAKATAEKLNSRARVPIAIAFLVLALLVVAIEYPAWRTGLEAHYEYANVADLPAIDWITQDALATNTRPIVLTTLRKSTAITPLSGNYLKTCGTVGAVLWPGPLVDELAGLDKASCDELRQAYKACGASYYYVPVETNCWWATPAIAARGVGFVYRLAP